MGARTPGVYRQMPAASARLIGGEGVAPQVALSINKKRAEEEMQELNNRLRTVVETVAEGITLRDANGHFLIFNSRMQEITGYTMEEANAAIDFTALLYPDTEARREAVDGVNDIPATGFSVAPVSISVSGFMGLELESRSWCGHRCWLLPARCLSGPVARQKRQPYRTNAITAPHPPKTARRAPGRRFSSDSR